MNFARTPPFEPSNAPPSAVPFADSAPSLRHEGDDGVPGAPATVTRTTGMRSSNEAKAGTTGATSRRLRHLAFVAIGLGLFAWTLRGADLSESGALITQLGLACVLIVLPQGLWTVVHAGAWKRILAGLGHRVPLTGLSTTFFATEAARLTFPAGPAVGESLSAYFLTSRFGVPVADGVASIATKKLLVVATNAIYALLGIAIAWSALSAASRQLFGGPLLLWLMGGFTIALTTLALTMAWSMRRGSLAMTVFRLLRAIPVARLRRYLDARADRWAEADAQLKRPLAGRSLGALVTPGVLMLAQWLLEAAETWLIFQLLGVPIGIGEALALEVAGNAIRSLAFAIPAGLGVQDAGYVAMLGAFGVPSAATVGVAFVLLKRMKELFWIGVGWLLMLAGRTARERIAEVEQT